MAHPLRSKNGCWTCRVRKKKCDERKPECETCVNLSIPCHGYGPKPDWVDNGNAERQVANGFKQAVRSVRAGRDTSLSSSLLASLSSSRRRIGARDTGARGASIQLAPRPPPAATIATTTATATNIATATTTTTTTTTTTPAAESVSSSSSDTNRFSETITTPDYSASPSPRDGLGSISEGAGDDASRKSSSPREGTSNGSFVAGAIPDQESILLMHFLDRVFPLQYPMYQADTFDGRGWLLSLLLRNKSLYYAALALSSYHRRVLFFEALSESCRAAATVSQEKHLEASLIEVRQAMLSMKSDVKQMRQLANIIEALSSIVQLVFFELFAGTNGVFMIHLNAAIDILYWRYKDLAAQAALSKMVLYGSQIISDDIVTSVREAITFRCMGSAVLWLDIISAMTTGAAPRLISHHPSALDPDSPTQLQDLMGCKNWAMRLVGRIAALHAYGKTAGQSGQSGVGNAVLQDMLSIRSEIDSGLAAEALEDLKLAADGDVHTLGGPVLSPTTVITRMFAQMAIVYLHLVTHGFRWLQDLEAPINAALELLRMHASCQLIPALIAPLFIIGCVARDGDEQGFLEMILASRAIQGPLYKHRAEMLRMVREVWSRRGRVWGAFLG